MFKLLPTDIGLKQIKHNVNYNTTNNKHTTRRRLPIIMIRDSQIQFKTLPIEVVIDQKKTNFVGQPHPVCHVSLFPLSYNDRQAATVHNYNYVADKKLRDKILTVRCILTTSINQCKPCRTQYLYNYANIPFTVKALAIDRALVIDSPI